jgi:hypothetical protein
MKKSTIYSKCCIDTSFGFVIPLGRNEAGLIYCKEVSMSPNGNDITYPVYSLSELQQLAHSFDGDDYSFTWGGALSDSTDYFSSVKFNFDELKMTYAVLYNFLNRVGRSFSPEACSALDSVESALSSLESRMKKDGYPID